MEAYTGFAEVYDLFMDNIPYEEWAEYVIELLKDYGITPESENSMIVDLGCGTGTFTEILADAGFQMIGIDNSEEMLVIANEKKYEDYYDSTEDEEMQELEAASEVEDSDSEDSDLELDDSDSEDSYSEDSEDYEDFDQEGLDQSQTIYSLQDMREFEVPQQVGAIVSVCDSMNYIIEEDGLVQVFGCVKEALDENGIFIFDMKTQHFFRDILGEDTIAENRGDAAFIWDNYYYEDEAVNEYELSIFVQEESGLFRKYEETHVQRGYTIEQVRNALSKAGLEILSIYDAFTHNVPSDDSERIYFVARR